MSTQLESSGRPIAWPRFESLAERTGVKLVGPAMTWGTMPGFEDPVTWLDAFYESLRSARRRDPLRLVHRPLGQGHSDNLVMPC